MPWTNASTTGEIAFCAYAAYLTHNGVQTSREAEARKSQGTADHEDWNERQEARAAGSPMATLLRVALLIGLGAAALALYGHFR